MGGASDTWMQQTCYIRYMAVHQKCGYNRLVTSDKWGCIRYVGDKRRVMQMRGLHQVYVQGVEGWWGCEFLSH